MADTTFLLGGDLPVHRLAFGAMRLTGYGPATDPAESIRIARRAVELGVDFLDTADSYGLGANEELLAAALHPYPDGLVIGTKAGQCRPTAGEWIPLGRPEYLRQQVELNLRRLRLDRLDLFQLHRVDPQVPIDDQMGALRQLQQDGKIRHVGLSDVTVDQIEAARATVAVVSVQNRYHLADRGYEDVLTYCEREGIAFIPYLPIGGGRHPELAATLAEIAGDLGATPAQVALAWLLRRSPVTVPIPGTSSMAHLEENVAARDLQLEPEQYDRLSAVGALD
ncbi:MAG: oxidoreductase [Streptosporangiales bacterium]|nr:oxidoreductase [Streptosporangiales bacterium]